MKKLAYWSKKNPIKAMIIIGLSHVLLVIIGIAMGIRTYLDEFPIPDGFLLLMVILFFTAYLFYPIRGLKTGIWKYSFSRRVKHDFILVMASTCVLAAGINNFAFQPLQNQVSQPQVSLMIVPENIGGSGLVKKELRKSILSKIKQMRTDIKQTLKLMKTDVQKGNGQKAGLKILLILLTVLVAAALWYSVAALSCQISCSGNEGLATVVLLGGTTAILALTILVIVKIVRIGKKTTEQKA